MAHENALIKQNETWTDFNLWIIRTLGERIVQLAMQISLNMMQFKVQESLSL